MKRNAFISLPMCMGLSACLVLHKGQIPRVEDVESSSSLSAAPVNVAVTFEHLVDVDGNEIKLSADNTKTLKEHFTDSLEKTKRIRVVDANNPDVKIAFRMKEFSHHNGWWFLGSAITLFIIPYHGENDYHVEVTLKSKSGLTKEYALDDGAESWAEVLLLPIGIFRWPRTVRDVLDNMFDEVAKRISVDLAKDSGNAVTGVAT